MAPHRDLKKTATIVLPKGEDAIWAMILKLDAEGTWTVPDVATFTGISHKVVRQYVAKLKACGYVREEPGTKCRKFTPARLHSVARPSREAPRISANGRDLGELKIETIWRTIRMLKRFTIAEVAGYVDPEDPAARVPSIRVYLHRLAEAGIIVRETPACGNQWIAFRLVKPLGPRAPKILSANIVYDPNAADTVGVAETREAVR